MFRARLALLLLSFVVSAAVRSAAEPPKAPPEQVDMATMMERAKQFTSPGPEHAWLARFLGEWETEARITMAGSETPGEKGTSRGRWLIEGRWLALEGEGSMMGMPFKTFCILGYDRFKMSYVTACVQSVDTALTTSEGDIDPKTGSLLTYGTLDEYLTGEHDKMVKYAWRFPDANTMRLEVHDLPIGETGTKVVEFSYKKKQGGAK